MPPSTGAPKCPPAAHDPIEKKANFAQIFACERWGPGPELQGQERHGKGRPAEDEAVATTRKMKRIMLGAVAVIGVAVSAAWIARSQQASNGATPVSQSSGPQSSGPLIARGYTEAPAGTVTVANDPNGGSVIRELRIK